MKGIKENKNPPVRNKKQKKTPKKKAK